MDDKDISATVLCPGRLTDGINDVGLTPPPWGVRMVEIQIFSALHSDSLHHGFARRVRLGCKRKNLGDLVFFESDSQ
jgi:hypothetical protein